MSLETAQQTVQGLAFPPTCVLEQLVIKAVSTKRHRWKASPSGSPATDCYPTPTAEWSSAGHSQGNPVLSYDPPALPPTNGGALESQTWDKLTDMVGEGRNCASRVSCIQRIRVR